MDPSNKSIRHRPVAAGLLVIALIVASVGITHYFDDHHGNKPGSATIHSTFNSSSELVSVRLPVYICHTTYGLSGEAAANLPKYLNEMVPYAASAHLVVYTDGGGVMKLLGPRGWDCTAGIGADGSSGIQIAPVTSSIWSSKNYIGTLAPRSRAEVIDGQQNGGCVGCGTFQACHLFAAAAQQLSSPSSCSAPPLSEMVTQLSKNDVEFTDPPGVHGDGYPSGGSYPARSVMTYFYKNGYDGVSSWMETCVLPPDVQSLCSVILGNFVSWYGTKAPWQS